MKRLAILLAVATAVHGQINYPPPNPLFIAGSTIAHNLPAAVNATSQFWAVTDGASASDCSTGGGTTGVICYSNGSSWTAVSGGGTATNLAGGSLGSVPYQSGTGATTFLASPTTSGHTFVLSWQPSGSVIAPVSLDLATYLASPTAIGGTTPAAGTFNPLSASSTTESILTNTTSGASVVGMRSYASNLSNAGQAIFSFGVNSTAGNAINLWYHHVSTGSASNYATWSFSAVAGTGIGAFNSTNDVVVNTATDCGKILCIGANATVDSSGNGQFATVKAAASRKGTFVCTAGGTITISNTNELATSDVIISMNAQGGTITTQPAFKTVTAGTGFTVLCGASDTSTYNYDIIN